MSIRKFRKTWWVDFRFESVRYRKKSPENSKAGAQAYEALLRQKLSRGEDIDSQEETKAPLFRDFAWKWFETYAKPNNKVSEIGNKEIALRMYLVPFFGKTRIDKISNIQIEEYKAKEVKRKKIKNKTINNHLTALSKCLHCAKDWDVITSVPKINKLKAEPFKFDFLTVEESEKLLQHAPGIWHDVFLILLKTGMRKGELLALTWENINWDRRQIVVSQSMYARVISSTKSNRIRYVDMTREVYSCLLKRKQARGFVFTDDEKNHFSMRRINDVLTRLCKEIGLRKINVHVLRHTFASHLAMAGAPIQAIQGLLGHSDIQTTMRYAHLSPSVFRETVNLLEPEAKNITFGQHVGNRLEIDKEFERVLRRDRPDKSANTKQKQLP